MYLFADTETTGFPLFREPEYNPEQAHVCQLAMILTDENGRSMAEMATLIKPTPEWKMNPKALETHGKTVEMCEQYGIKQETAFDLFVSMASRAQLIVCHNVNFDKKMMEIEAYRAQRDLPAKQWHCTMLETTPICKIPGNYSAYKWPKMTEAYKHFFGKEFDGAHDALNDVRACRDVFFKLREVEKETAA